MRPNALSDHQARTFSISLFSFLLTLALSGGQSVLCLAVMVWSDSLGTTWAERERSVEACRGKPKGCGSACSRALCSGAVFYIKWARKNWPAYSPRIMTVADPCVSFCWQLYPCHTKPVQTEQNIILPPPPPTTTHSTSSVICRQFWVINGDISRLCVHSLCNLELNHFQAGLSRNELW